LKCVAVSKVEPGVKRRGAVNAPERARGERVVLFAPARDVVVVA
jgi:hypothetical protein